MMALKRELKQLTLVAYHATYLNQSNKFLNRCGFSLEFADSYRPKSIRQYLGRLAAFGYEDHCRLHPTTVAQMKSMGPYRSAYLLPDMHSSSVLWTLGTTRRRNPFARHRFVSM